MIEIKATVVDQAPGTIWVTTQQGCLGCQSGCGLADVGRFLTRHNPTVALTCHNEATPASGEEVTIALSEPALLRAGLFVYLIPAIFIVLGAALATLIAGSDSSAIAGALGGLTLGIIFMRWVSHHSFSLATPQLVQTAFSTSGDLDNECSNG
jgi:sigma-E factor negative regulatory protein RseC